LFLLFPPTVPPPFSCNLLLLESFCGTTHPGTCPRLSRLVTICHPNTYCLPLFTQAVPVESSLSYLGRFLQLHIFPPPIPQGALTLFTSSACPPPHRFASPSVFHAFRFARASPLKRIFSVVEPCSHSMKKMPEHVLAGFSNLPPTNSTKSVFSKPRCKFLFSGILVTPPRPGPIFFPCTATECSFPHVLRSFTVCLFAPHLRFFPWPPPTSTLLVGPF